MTDTLRDGSRVDVRPIEPDDRQALADAFEQMSEESRYRRFFGPMPELSDRYLDYLTQVDHHDHEAVVATDAATGAGVGVARYVRTGTGAAEPAIAVVDAWQGRGVAGLLLSRLVDRARAEGVERFEAPVLAGNREAIRVLERLGHTTRRSEGREVRLTIDLPGDRAALPRLVARVRRVTAGVLGPARTVGERVWPRRPGRPGDPRRNVIVVGTDGSRDADAAVETAADLAGATGASVEVVGVHRLLPPEQEELRVAVHDAAGTLRGRGLHVHEHLRRGDSALVLTDVAAEQQARLIVVGASGRGKTTRRLIGSVADFVAERSPCDVLIVRPRRS